MHLKNLQFPLLIYVDDIETAIDKVKKAGGSINAPAIPLAGLEAGDGNFFCYTKTPWGSTIELLTYPSANRTS